MAARGSSINGSESASTSFPSSRPKSENRMVAVATAVNEETASVSGKEEEVGVIRPFVSGNTSHNCMECPVSPDHVQFWSKNGYLLMDDIFNDQLITLVRDATIPLVDNDQAREEFGRNKHISRPFPFAESDTLVLNKIPLHSRLNQAVMSLLHTEHYEILLSFAEVSMQMKSSDHPLHLDIVNQQSLMLPDCATDRHGERIPEALTAVVYLDEGDTCAGFTHLVPNHGSWQGEDLNYKSTEDHVLSNLDDSSLPWDPLWSSPGLGEILWKDDRCETEACFFSEENPHRLIRQQAREKLYRSEKRMHFSKGTTLFLRHDVWQRQTPITPNKILRTALDRIIAEGNFAQRCLLGFPSPKSRYWTTETVLAMRQRYQYIPGGFRHHIILTNIIKERAKGESNVLVSRLNDIQQKDNQECQDVAYSSEKQKKAKQWEKNTWEQMPKSRSIQHRQDVDMETPSSLLIPHQPVDSLDNKASSTSPVMPQRRTRQLATSPTIATSSTTTSPPMHSSKKNVPRTPRRHSPHSPRVSCRAVVTDRHVSPTTATATASSALPVIFRDDITNNEQILSNVEHADVMQMQSVVRLKAEERFCDEAQREARWRSDRIVSLRAAETPVSPMSISSISRSTNGEGHTPRHSNNTGLTRHQPRSPPRQQQNFSNAATSINRNRSVLSRNSTFPIDSGASVSNANANANTGEGSGGGDDDGSVDSEDLDDLLDIRVKEDCTGRYLTYVNQFYR